jgi:hypothetical protein
VSGCSFDTGGVSKAAHGDGAPDDVTRTDGADRRDAAPCPWPQMPLYVDPCHSARPPSAAAQSLMTAGIYQYDTDSGMLTDPGGVPTTWPSSTVAGAHVVWLDSLLVGAQAILRAQGSAPLIIVSKSFIEINNRLEVNSFHNGSAFVLGAGANSDACPLSPPDPGLVCAQHAGSGGGAGAFGGAGGNGGEGGDTSDCGGGFTSGIPGGAGGEALAAVPSAVRAGCAGRDGSANDKEVGGGAGGPGGGAVYLVARDVVRVNGTIHAGGAGGRGGNGNRSGGGGGGSGGLIGIDSVVVELNGSAMIAANGGGGGGGCDGNRGGPGQDGLASGAAAKGGTGEGKGGPGGAGGAGTTPAGASADTAERGGGGGGGGVGFVIIRAATLTAPNEATVSPPQVSP